MLEKKENVIRILILQSRAKKIRIKFAKDTEQSFSRALIICFGTVTQNHRKVSRLCRGI